MATQQYCLRWNNHQPNFISVFSSLLNSESLVDVTLAAEGRHLQAHKVVLSACSSYFQSLFTINPCQHPIVILKDVKFLDLKVMVDFMYYGEVNVSQEQLPHILKTAEMLKIKGLAEIPVEQQTLSKQQSSGAERTDHPPPADPNSNETHHRQSLSPSPCPPSPLSKSPMPYRKRLRKTSTGSGSGSAEKADEHAPEAATSVIRSEGYSEPKHVEPDPAQYTPQPEFRASPKQPNDESLATTGIPETYEENKPVVTIHAQLSQQFAQQGLIMGTKRGRFLMRQQRIKRESDPTQQADAEPSGHYLTVPPVRMERQCSDPLPTISPPPGNLLTVPGSILLKQHSHPLLLGQSQSISSPPLVPFDHCERVVSPVVLVTDPMPHEDETTSTPTLRIRTEELKRSASSPQQSATRSSHCPAVRPGPALGCNYCWNTVDTHGRILRRKTKYHCPECQTNLCIVPCFQEYHEKHVNPIALTTSVMRVFPKTTTM